MAAVMRLLVSMLLAASVLMTPARAAGHGRGHRHGHEQQIGPQPPPDDAQRRAPASQTSPRPRGHRMVVAGVAVTIASVGAYGLLGAGLGVGNRAESDLVRLWGSQDIAERQATVRRGQLGNRLAIGSAIAATVAAGVGITLIVIGRRRAQADVRAGQARLMIRTRGLGLGLSLRL